MTRSTSRTRSSSCLADPQRCERMGEIGRARIEDELSWSRQVPKLVKAYETLFARR